MKLDTVNGSGSGAETALDPALQSVESAAVSTGLRRLHPADGLFLRAEHLDQIQTYARELAQVGALAGGTGVAYGFALDLDPVQERVGAGAGLAIDPSGQALRSRGRLEVDLSGLERDVAGRIWIVEVAAAPPIPSGNEPVYAAACASPCGPDSAIQPWLDDAVELRVRAETLTGDWVNADAQHVLSALVSAYFEQERRRGLPWLTPASAGAAVPRLDTRPWASAAPAAAPGPAAVPLGLLARIGGAWHLDVWAARRDRVLSPPAAAWAGRLSLRPQPVFTAQLLQFEDQLAAGALDPDHPLTARFRELPPAGYLPMPAARDVESLGIWLKAVFDDTVQLRLARVSADVAVSAVNLAQHLDRIPLIASAEVPAAVTILVPDIPADLPAVTAADYGWLAFVREPRVGGIDRVDRQAEPVPAQPPGAPETVPAPPPAAPAQPPAAPETATVAAHVVEAPVSRARYRQRVETAAAEAPTARVRFAGDGWDLAADAAAIRRLRKAVEEGGPYSAVDVVATTAEPAGEPLAAARARALAARLGPDDTEIPSAVYSTRGDGADAVFIMVRRVR